jgi:hypothetical protein
MYYNRCICESSGIDIYCTKQASDYLLARSSENDRSRLSCPAVQLAPDAIERRTTNAGKVAVRCSSIVVLDGLASYKDAAQDINNQLLVQTVELDLPCITILCDRQSPRRVSQHTCRRWTQVEAHTHRVTTSPLGGRNFLVLPIRGALNLGVWCLEREVERGVEFAIFRPCVARNSRIAPHEVYVQGCNGP